MSDTTNDETGCKEKTSYVQTIGKCCLKEYLSLKNHTLSDINERYLLKNGKDIKTIWVTVAPEPKNNQSCNTKNSPGDRRFILFLKLKGVTTGSLRQNQHWSSTIAIRLVLEHCYSESLDHKWKLFRRPIETWNKNIKWPFWSGLEQL